MKDINRSSVSVPSNLQNLTNVQAGHLSDHKKISSAVYRHNDVMSILDELYYQKCYICECDVEGNYEVEHYRPKKEFPLFGYTWENLHKSCGPCNTAKNANAFKLIVGQTVTDMLLLDPTDVSYNIKDYLYFNIHSDAELNDVGSDPLVIRKAKQTIKYLNDKKNSHPRAISSLSFMQAISSKIISQKERIVTIHAGLPDYTCPVSVANKAIDEDIYKHLSILDHLYLRDAAEYSTSTRVQLRNTLGLTYEDFSNILSKLRQCL